MTTPAVRLAGARELREARRLIESHGLRFEAGCDDFAGIYEEERLVATGARAGFVLKMFAVEPEHQGGPTLGALIEELMRFGRAAGEEVFWVFTRPESAGSFLPFHFRLLATSGRAVLLEHGGGFERWAAAESAGVLPGRNGACVINGNPFTLGHLYLVEQASRRVDTLCVFIVREDRSVFPYAVRRRLAESATAHLPNVAVRETSRYAVSAGTFPSYFLKSVDAAALEQMRMDASLFGQRIAPAFHVRTRFVGHEPYDPTTAAYNQAMREVLPSSGIELVEVERTAGAEGPGAFISATRVRSALARGDYASLRRWVPPATLEFLESDEGRRISSRLAASG